MRSVLSNIAVSHAKAGIGAQHYKPCVHALFASLEQLLGPEYWTYEVKNAWIQAYSVLCNVMVPVSVSVLGTTGVVHGSETTPNIYDLTRDTDKDSQHDGSQHDRAPHHDMDHSARTHHSHLSPINSQRHTPHQMSIDMTSYHHGGHSLPNGASMTSCPFIAAAGGISMRHPIAGTGHIRHEQWNYKEHEQECQQYNMLSRTINHTHRN